MTLVEIVEATEFNEDELRFYFRLIASETFLDGRISALILVAAAQHLLVWQRDMTLPGGIEAIDQFGELVRLVAPQYARRPRLFVVGGTDFSPVSSTSTGADNAQ
jgi:hypothetical protein